MTTLRLDPYQETRKANGDIIRPGSKGRQERYGGPIWYETPAKAGEDIDIEHLVLDVVHNTKKLKDLEISDIIVDGELERTIDGASTFRLTLHDPDQELLKNGRLERAIDVNLDGLWFRLVRVEKQGSNIILEFEDRLVSYLRQHKRVIRAGRDKFTRLEFCLRLVRTVKAMRIPVVCPELHIKQEIEKLKKADRRAVAQDVTLPGLNVNDDLTVKGVKITRKQARILEDMLDQAEKMSANEKMMMAMVMAAIQESVVGKLRVSSTGYHVGILHQDSRPGSTWNQLGGGGSTTSEKHVRGQAKAFTKVARDVYAENHGISAAELALQVQRPGGGAGQYGQWKEEAENIVAAWGGRPGDSGTVTRTFRKRYRFTTEEGNKVGGKAQDYWTALGSLLDETNFRRFVSNGFLYMISEDQLMRGKVRMVLTHDTHGVVEINFSHDVGENEATATVTCRAGRWVAPPGTIIKLKDCGPANGKWLVENIRRNMYARDAEITLKRKDPKLKEPRPEVGSKDFGGDAAEGPEINGWPGPVSAAYRQARRIHNKHYPYIWGGGHAKAGTPDQGSAGSYNDAPGAGSSPGYDCSGSTAAVLAAGGWYQKGDSVPRSDILGKGYDGWRNGRGKYITVWSNAQHIFIEFHKDGEKDKDPPLYGPFEPGCGVADKTMHFGTGRWGKTWTGPGFNPQLHPKAGFVATHPQGF